MDSGFTDSALYMSVREGGELINLYALVDFAWKNALLRDFITEATYRNNSQKQDFAAGIVTHCRLDQHVVDNTGPTAFIEPLASGDGGVLCMEVHRQDPHWSKRDEQGARAQAETP